MAYGAQPAIFKGTAVPGTGIFADLAGLVLTIDPTTAAAGISCNISDGTNTYKFWFACENSNSTPGLPGVLNQSICVNFDPAIPGTTAATAWTIALSAADATVYYVMTFVLQKAS
jgi:hypothetical protein